MGERERLAHLHADNEEKHGTGNDYNANKVTDETLHHIPLTHTMASCANLLYLYCLHTHWDMLYHQVAPLGESVGGVVALAVVVDGRGGWGW
jgi:hypothetical protein